MCYGGSIKNVSTETEQVGNIKEYVSAIKNFAKKGRLGGLQEEFIHDQIIMHTSNPDIQDKLWVNVEAPLKEVIALVKKAELTGRCAKAIEGDLHEVKHVQVVKGEKKNNKNETKAKVNNQKDRFEGLVKGCLATEARTLVYLSEILELLKEGRCSRVTYTSLHYVQSEFLQQLAA
ncbi:hypothetical protein NDU88_001173 [Pleurodeles waltl]|uniref:Uncharacterized protein n=1 Tax=Pleurodeles waltl TaxID=8319 RepID=A0AAV7R728_PLEWA|nr:hypothetical protein NDU88_001173 [Pleurodeles waltl]